MVISLKHSKMNFRADNTFQTGDLVFAKMRGYRPWPARILESTGRKYNVFFYGTCNTAKIDMKNVFAYEKYIRRLGNTSQVRHREFKRAMLHVEFILKHPEQDDAYNYYLANTKDSDCTELKILEDSQSLDDVDDHTNQ